MIHDHLLMFQPLRFHHVVSANHNQPRKHEKATRCSSAFRNLQAAQEGAHNSGYAHAADLGAVQADVQAGVTLSARNGTCAACSKDLVQARQLQQATPVTPVTLVCSFLLATVILGESAGETEMFKTIFFFNSVFASLIPINAAWYVCMWRSGA